MPIYLNEELRAWEAKDLDDSEKESLINIATNVIIDALGETLARKLMQAAGARMELENTPTEEMYTA
jgi:hypothetical protein